MSRSYRIKVRESLRRVIRAADHVRAQLEILEILPPEQMAEILAAELVVRGFEREDNKAIRTVDDITVEVELTTGAVTVRAESREHLNLEDEKEARVYDDQPRQESQTRRQVSEQIKKKLETQATMREAALQKQVTDRLEGELADIRQELDQAVNKATAEALKQKAAQMGQIKSVSEEPNGSLTIVVEV